MSYLYLNKSKTKTGRFELLEDDKMSITNIQYLPEIKNLIALTSSVFSLTYDVISGKSNDASCTSTSDFKPGPASTGEPRITSMINDLQSMIQGDKPAGQFTTLTVVPSVWARTRF